MNNYERNGWQHLISGVGDTPGKESCELWVNLALPIGQQDGQLLYLQRQNTRVIHAGEKLLVCEVNHPWLQARIIVGHAPHSETDDDQFAQWHEQFDHYMACARD
eukprot:12424824-Karenia_brevis.AAC.1